MNHAQIRAFHAVASLGGFSRAAEALGLTQPAVSEQVKRLEQAQDALLFTRSRKGVTLTQAGEGLYTLTKRYFAVEAEIDGYFADRADALAGRLRIIADAAQHVTPLLERFRARHPAVRIEIRSGNTDSILTALRGFDADIGVVGTLPAAADLATLNLGASPIIGFALKGTHSAPSATLADLARHPWILREDGSRTRSIILDQAAALGLRPDIAVEAQGREAVRAVVLSGSGIGFVSQAEYVPDDRFQTVTLSDLPDQMSESVVHLKQRAGVRLIRAFMQSARAAVES